MGRGKRKQRILLKGSENFEIFLAPWKRKKEMKERRRTKGERKG
jgi:hypothetical protein